MINTKNILSSWQDNAPAWIHTIETNEIKSRQLITNRAVIEEILSVAPSSVLDAGCGEGWLCREMEKHGIKATGIDGVKALIEQAKKAGTNNYYTISYEDVINDKKNSLDTYDAITFNYSIFEDDAVIQLFNKLKKHLTKNGKIIIQTISPANELFLQRPENGWMTESWCGLNPHYKTAFKWYYRSESEWLDLFSKTGFKLLNKREHINPEDGKYFSVIYTIRDQCTK